MHGTAGAHVHGLARLRQLFSTTLQDSCSISEEKKKFPSVDPYQTPVPRKEERRCGRRRRRKMDLHPTRKMVKR